MMKRLGIVLVCLGVISSAIALCLLRPRDRAASTRSTGPEQALQAPRGGPHGKVQSGELDLPGSEASDSSSVPERSPVLVESSDYLVRVEDTRGESVLSGRLTLTLWGEGGDRESRAYQVSDGFSCPLGSWPLLSGKVRNGDVGAIRFSFNAVGYEPRSGWLSELRRASGQCTLIVRKVIEFHFVVGPEDESDTAPSEIRLTLDRRGLSQASVMSEGPEFRCVVWAVGRELPLLAIVEATGYHPVFVRLEQSGRGDGPVVELGRFGIAPVGDSLAGGIWLDEAVPLSNTPFQLSSHSGEVVYRGVTSLSGEFEVRGLDQGECLLDLTIPVVGESEVGLPATVSLGMYNRVLVNARVYVLSIAVDDAPGPASSSGPGGAIELAVESKSRGEGTSWVRFQTERHGGKIKLMVPNESSNELAALYTTPGGEWFGAQVPLDDFGGLRMIEEQVQLTPLVAGEVRLIPSLPDSAGIQCTLRQVGTGFAADGTNLSNYSLGRVYQLPPGTWRAMFDSVATRGKSYVAESSEVTFEVKPGERSEVVVQTVLGGQVDLSLVANRGFGDAAYPGVDTIALGDAVTIGLVSGTSEVKLKFSRIVDGVSKAMPARLLAKEGHYLSSRVRPGVYSLIVRKRESLVFSKEISITSGGISVVEVPLAL